MASCINHRLDTQALNSPPKRGNSSLIDRFAEGLEVLVIGHQSSLATMPQALGKAHGIVHRQFEKNRTLHRPV